MTLQALSRKGLVIAMTSAPLLLGACASTKSVDEAKAMAQRAQATADQALTEARAADGKVNALSDRVDRMYQHSLRK